METTEIIDELCKQLKTNLNILMSSDENKEHGLSNIKEKIKQFNGTISGSIKRSNKI